MNALEWLQANVGKKVRMVRHCTGNNIKGVVFENPVLKETHEDVLEAPTTGEYGWAIRFKEVGIFCFNSDELGESNEKTAIVNCETGSGNVFRHEFTLLD